MSRLCHDRGIRPHVFDKIPTTGDTALDLGFGFGEFGIMVRARNHNLKRFVGVDIWPPYCENMEKMKVYDEVVCADAVAYMEELDWRPDFCLCTEVAEHIQRYPKDLGGRLLDLIYEKCDRALVATPLDWVPVEAGFDGNPASEHVSTYKVKDFTDRGYKIKIVDNVALPHMFQLPYRIIAKILGRHVYRHIFAWKDV